MAPLLKIIPELIKSISNLTTKVIDACDPEKHARSVEQLHQGVSDTYDTMRKVIMESKTFSDEEKLQKLAEISKQEENSKERCAEVLKGHREHVSKIAMEVFAGLVTCGISCIPGVTKSFHALMKKQNIELSAEDQKLLEASSVES